MIQLQCQLGQAFGGHANGAYDALGLKGHPGTDERCGYGTDIASYVRALVYDLYTPLQPASDGYTAILMIVQTPLETFEMLVGHVSQINVSIGDFVEKGAIIGKEGNKGLVYSGNTLITLAEQHAGNQEGSHRHWQKRPCMQVPRTRFGGVYLNSRRVAPYRSDDGYYYEVYSPFNGYNGCVDWLAPLWPRNLAPGMSGYDVYLLQKAMAYFGRASFAPTGFFGPLTALSLASYQRSIGLSPVGLCGPQTRIALSRTFEQV